MLSRQLQIKLLDQLIRQQANELGGRACDPSAVATVAGSCKVTISYTLGDKKSRPHHFLFGDLASGQRLREVLSVEQFEQIQSMLQQSVSAGAVSQPGKLMFELALATTTDTQSSI
jgi:hypothetical protein